ncbi:MAG: tripartite tricarboxylate transporter substrate binding protein [Deltaproteobacteria bacterium]|nr:tripartite tricarboxylate transporter substrate binding protein [Deltaproteobacteria bacterium]
MKTTSLTFAITLSFLFVCVFATSGFAQETKYPTRRIQYIFPWKPGIPMYVMAQMTCEYMSKVLGKKVTISAMPGGSGAKSHHHVLNQPADGYTLLDSWVAPLIFVVLNRPDIGYTYKDFEPIGGMTLNPFTLVVRKDQPFKTLEEFIQYARKNPGLKYNTGGEVTVPHAVMAAFLKKAGIKARGVPYPGVAAGFKDFLGGTLDFSVGVFGVIKTYGDRIRTLCLFLDERHPWFPEIPTAKELGYDPGFGMSGAGWNFLVVKKGTPDYALNKLRAALKQVLTSEEYIKEARKRNFIVNYSPPEDYEAICEKAMKDLAKGIDAIKWERELFKK